MVVADQRTRPVGECPTRLNDLEQREKIVASARRCSHTGCCVESPNVAKPHSVERHVGPRAELAGGKGEQHVVGSIRAKVVQTGFEPLAEPTVDLEHHLCRSLEL